MRWSREEDKQEFLRLRTMAKTWIDGANKVGAGKDGAKILEMSLRNAQALAAVAELYRGNEEN
jgi:hypothetical protein